MLVETQCSVRCLYSLQWTPIWVRIFVWPSPLRIGNDVVQYRGNLHLCTGSVVAESKAHSCTGADSVPHT